MLTLFKLVEMLFLFVGGMVATLLLVCVGLFLWVEFDEWRMMRYCKKNLVVQAVDVIAKEQEAKDAKRANNTDDE